MSPVSTLVLTITPRTAAPSEQWVMLAYEGNLLAKTPAHLNLQQILALGYSFGAPQYDMPLYTARLTSKISHTWQTLIGQAGSTATVRRNTLLKIRKIFRLLIEGPREKRRRAGVPGPCGHPLVPEHHRRPQGPAPTPNEENQA